VSGGVSGQIAPGLTWGNSSHLNTSGYQFFWAAAVRHQDIDEDMPSHLSW